MNLRPYQLDVIQDTRLSFVNGKTKPLVVLPCGAGKTVCFAYMSKNHVSKNSNNVVWFMVHRKELIDQTVETFKRMNLDMNNIQVGMVQSYKKMTGNPSMIIFDEAHHATANTWKKIIQQHPNIPIIGLTATPARMNGEPLGTIFNNLVLGPEPEELIKMGFLSEYDYYAPKINVKDADFVIKGADFDLEAATVCLENAKAYGTITSYLSKARKTIIYSPSIRFSKELCKKIPWIVHFDGETPKNERDRIVKEFREGKIRALSNVDLIGEGFDVPDCDCVMLLRPTMSLTLYIQQSMRALRPQENKRAIIYDFVGNVFRHGMPTETRAWSLENKLTVRNKTEVQDLIVRQCGSCLRVYKGTHSICPYCKHDNGKTRKQIEQDEQVELQKIQELERRTKKKEQSRAWSLEQLVEIGRQRGYKNPYYWAKQIMKARKRI